MQKQADQPSRGVLPALAGVVAIGIAALLVSNADEDGFFLPLGVVVGAVGLYLVIVGGVARGIQLSRD